jgi:alpha-glucosidase
MQGGALVACLEGGELRVNLDDGCAASLRSHAGEVLWTLAPARTTRASEPGTGPDEGQRVTVQRFEQGFDPSAAILGCGEHTGPLDRSATRFTHWNTDAYNSNFGGWAPDADPLYASLPFCTLLGDTAAAGLFWDATPRARFDLGAARPGQARLDLHGEAPPTLWLIPAATPAQAAKTYADLTGPAALPPRWAFGFHQSRWGYERSAQVLEIAREFRRLRLPLDTMWLDIQHMDGFRTFTFDPSRFGDPARWLAELEQEGLYTVAIADPGIKVDEGWPLYREARDQALFLREPDGRDYVGAVWPGPSSFPDFTLPQARAWWGGEVASLARLGLDGVWLDVNEPTNFPEGGGGMTVPNRVLARGLNPPATMAEVHNFYANLETQATWDGLLEAHPQRRPLVVSRAGYAGIQRHAGLWTGDVPSTWWGLAQTLPMLANLSASGVPFVGSDVGGYSGGATPELFARWMQLGVLSPFFRAHVTNGVPGQEPWRFGQEVTDISRFWLRERYRLTPYFEALALAAARDGAPPLRPLAWEFGRDLAHVEDEVMLGPFVLAAPVLTQGATERAVVLPPGRWVEYASGLVVEGRWTANLTLAAMPLFLREGAILPRVEPAESTQWLDYDRVQLDVFPSTTPTSITLLNDDGDGWAFEGDAPPTMTVSQHRPTSTTTLLQGTDNRGFLGALLRVRVRLDRASIRAATLDGQALPQLSSLDPASDAPGFYIDVNDRSAWAIFRTGEAWRLELEDGDPLPDPATVALTVEVVAPQGTPTDAPIHIAGTFNGWTHQPLAWVEPGRRARGTIAVPRGAWYDFKYTRGSWDSVEKWPNCQEASDRYAFGAADAPRQDEVWDWRDLCE